jgi:hypothetical protein
VVRSFVAAMLAAVCVFPSMADASSCALSNGQPIFLRASDFDPDVLVWDTRQRAIDYVDGIPVSTSDVLTHTLLARPGTRAVVVLCDPGSAKRPYSDAILDTVGIKITTGPNKGRYGWVTSDDAHLGTTAQSALQKG